MSLTRLRKIRKYKRELSGKLIITFLFFIYILITFMPKIGFAQTSILINIDSDGVGTEDGRGIIYIGGEIFIGLPASTEIDTGYHIIFYLPHEEDRFLEWVVSGGIRLESLTDPRINAYGIYVTGPCSIYARYEVGPILNIENVHPGVNDVLIDAPIELKVKITSEDKLIDEAKASLIDEVKVSFYANGRLVGTEDTENGYASIIYELTSAREYKWYVKAEKVSYKSNTSPTLNFDYVIINLNPKDKEVFDSLPIVLNVEVKYQTILIGTASFLLDDDYLGDHGIQVNGFASYTVRTLSPGLHKWNVIIDTEKFGIIKPSPKEFYLIISPTANLKYPINDENITKPTTEITLMARVLWENLPIKESNVSFHIDGLYKGSNKTDDDGIATYRFYPEEEGRYYKWYVEAEKEYCNNATSPEWGFFYPIQPPYIEVDETFTTIGRADIDSNQIIGFHLRWENGSDVKGAQVRITDDLTTSTHENGWAHFPVSNPTVCKQTWEILEVSHPGMGDFKNNIAPPYIIWDKIKIEISIQRPRVDVGTRLNPIYEAYYEYDKDEFVGRIFYDTDLYSDIVQDKDITVQRMTDDKYGLSIFSCNVINVIWDRVCLELDINNDKFQVGSEADISVRGWYEYDDVPFNGHYELSNTIRQNAIGMVTYKIIQITDPRYSLTKFQSNEVSCKFDDIEIDQRVEAGMPSQVKVITKVAFKSDGSAVENAVVDVNGEGVHMGNGVYISTIKTLMPRLLVNTKVSVTGYEIIFTSRTITLTGNLLMESGLLISFIAITSIQSYRSYRKAQIWTQNLNELEVILKKRKGVDVKQIANEMNVEARTIKKLFAELVAKARIQGELVKKERGILLDEVPLKRIKSQMELRTNDLSKDLDITRHDAERIAQKLFDQKKFTGELIPTADGLHVFTFPAWNKRLNELENLLKRSKAVKISSISKNMKIDPKITKLLFANLRSKKTIRAELVKKDSIILPDEIVIKRIDELQRAKFRKLAKDLDITIKKAEKITRRLKRGKEIKVFIGHICPKCGYLRQEALEHVKACHQCKTPFGNWEKGFELEGTKIFR